MGQKGEERETITDESTQRGKETVTNCIDSSFRLFVDSNRGEVMKEREREGPVKHKIQRGYDDINYSIPNLLSVLVGDWSGDRNK